MAQVFRKFPSIMQPEKYGFAFDSDAWSTNNSYGVEAHFRMFETYGDGITQHSVDFPVPPDNLADYLWSATKYLLENSDYEMADRMEYSLLCRPSAATIAFCAKTAVYTEKDKTNNSLEKTRYFSVKECKMATRKKAEYDKRYEELGERHNGSPQAILGMLVEDWFDGLRRLVYAKAVMDWFRDVEGTYMGNPVELVGWFRNREGKETSDTHDLSVAVSGALSQAQDLVKAFRDRQNVKAQLECYLYNLESRRKADKETAETAA